LDPKARYTIRNLDEPDTKQEFSGRELAEKGVPVAIPQHPDAVVLLYTRLK
jgi:hypothetical protein